MRISQRGILKIRNFQRFINADSLFVASLAASRAASFLFVFLALRAFEPSEYLNFLKLYSLQPLVQTVSSSGVNEILIPAIYSKTPYVEGKQSIAKEHLFSVLVATLAALAIIIPPFLSFETDINLRLFSSTCLIGYGIVYLALNAEVTYNNLNSRRIKAAAINLILNIFIPGGSLLLAALTNHPALYSVFLCALAFIALIGTASLSNYKLSIKYREFKLFNFATFKTVFYSLTSSIASWLSGFGIMYLSTYLYDPIRTAIFSAMFSISSVSGVIATLFNQSWSPYFYQTYSLDGIAGAEKASSTFFNNLAVALTGIVILVTSLLPYYISIFLHLPKLDILFATRSLVILSVSYLCSYAWFHSQNYLLLLGKTKYITTIYVLSTAIPFLLCFELKNMIYLPSLIFLSQAFLRSFLGVLFVKRILSVNPPMLQSLIPSIIVLLIFLH